MSGGARVPPSSRPLASALRLTSSINYVTGRQGLDGTVAVLWVQGRSRGLISGHLQPAWSARLLGVFMNQINLAPDAGRQAKFTGSIFPSKWLSSPSEYRSVIEPILAVPPPQGRLPIYLPRVEAVGQLLRWHCPCRTSRRAGQEGRAQLQDLVHTRTARRAGPQPTQPHCPAQGRDLPLLIPRTRAVR